jgi:hypothetical protein
MSSNPNEIQQESVTPDLIAALTSSCGRESPWKLQVETDKAAADAAAAAQPAVGEKKNALRDAAALGVAALFRSEGRLPASAPLVESVPVSQVTRKRVKLAESGKPLVERGDILQSTAFGFTIRVQEITEDGGFLGRAPGVGRIRVRGEELGGYAKIGAKI